MNLGKVVGELANPKNMTVGSNNLLDVMKVATIFDPDVVVSRSNIKLGENGGIFDFVNEVGYEG